MAASGFTDYAAQIILGFLFGGQAFPTRPTSFWLGASTTAPNAAGALTEPSGNGYGRASVGTNWATPSGSGTVQSANSNLIQFPVATGPGWGTIVGWTLFDALSGGNKWTFGQLPAGIPVGASGMLQFASGEIINQLVSASGPFTGFTDFAAAAILHGLLKDVSFGNPGTWYLGVSTTPLTAAGAFTEPTTGGYTRKAIPANATNWPTAGTGATIVTLSNLLAQQMANLTLSWGALVSWALFDALTAGNAWIGGLISPTLTPLVGQALYVPPGTLVPTMTSSS